MGASGSLAEGTPQWGAQEAEAARLEWRHCSVTWGKDCKARKMMTLTVNVILFLFGRQIFSFPIWNGLASLRSQISVFLVNMWERVPNSQTEVEDLVTGSWEKRIQYFMGRWTMADVLSSGRERKRLTSKMTGLTWLSWAGISEIFFFYHVSGGKKQKTLLAL